ncbi:MAG: DUF4349 domain-containing protein, partial [Thermoleophilia bacterium]|nr:DUF4349 domain-containing protein [Thermoleophilia bacterium]
MLRAAASFPRSPRGRIIIVLLAVAIVAVAVAIATPPVQNTANKESSRADGNVRGLSSSLKGTAPVASDAVGGSVGESADSLTQANGNYLKSAAATTSMGTVDAAAPATETGGATETTGGAVSLDPKIARTAAMEVLVKRGSFDSAWRRATDVATAAGGSVTASSTSTAGNDARTGNMTLRVPSDHFQRALDGLSAVGKVRSLATGSVDQTQEYVDTSSRLRHDRAVESRLLTLLARTATVSEALAVQNRLDTLQSEIEVETGRIQYLTNITSFSTIELTISERGHVANKPRTAHTSSLGHALKVAGDRFTANVASGIVWLGGALPLL